jgi:PAS domain S-box-containing protein
LKSEIRERRRKEKLLQESEARARTLVEHAPEAIVVYDGDTGKFVDANENALTLFGIRRENLLEFAPHDFSPIVQADGKLSVESSREKRAEVLAGGEPVFEWIHRNAHGELIPCEVRLVRYPAEGRNLIRGSITNISERKRAEQALRESEEKFRALFEASSQGVMLHDEKQFLEINPAASRILGYDVEDLIGLHPSAISVPTQSNGESAEVLSRRHINDCMTRGTARFEWLARSKNGREIPLEVFLTRIPMSGRQLIQAVVNDISERKKAESELLKALTREKELSQLKTNFVSTVSHEFRTPLGIIMSSAQILADYFEQLSREEREEHLRSITRNCGHMAKLMEEVLLLSRVDSGKMICEPAPLNLAAFCRRLIDEIGSATNRHCPIQLKLPQDVNEVRADERLLRYIFSNLLSNAVKYSPPDAPVEFSLQRNDSQLVCCVRDFGIGIPEADREWLFSAFHRGRNVGDRPGTGLGLTIVKRCVDLHDGRIKFESGAGAGTLVTVFLPVFT